MCQKLQQRLVGWLVGWSAVRSKANRFSSLCVCLRACVRVRVQVCVRSISAALWIWQVTSAEEKKRRKRRQSGQQHHASSPSFLADLIRETLAVGSPHVNDSVNLISGPLQSCGTSGDGQGWPITRGKTTDAEHEMTRVHVRNGVVHVAVGHRPHVSLGERCCSATARPSPIML